MPVNGTPNTTTASRTSSRRLEAKWAVHALRIHNREEEAGTLGTRRGGDDGERQRVCAVRRPYALPLDIDDEDDDSIVDKGIIKGGVAGEGEADPPSQFLLLLQTPPPDSSSSS